MSEGLSLMASTLSDEFSDISNLGEFTLVSVRLLVAALLGGVLGLERERRGKPAGVRTHMLVAIGAALFILVPQRAGISDEEMSRVIQGVITGIGFLCAGAIIKGSDEQHLSGLTTAAGIWLTAAIGVAVGLGRELTAILCTLLAWLVLYAVPRLVRRFTPKGNPYDDEPDL